jgi:hypothetical protein
MGESLAKKISEVVLGVPGKAKHTEPRLVFPLTPAD